MKGVFASENGFLKKLTEITESNLTNAQFGVSELAREMGMSRSNLHLRVKKLTKLSASQFIKQIRLKKAMALLQQGILTISETAFDCGFQSVSYFSKCFREYYGYPPGEVARNSLKVNYEVKNQDKSNQYKKWISVIFLTLAIVIPIATASYNIFIKKIFSPKSAELEKSIAVLPFKYENRETTNAYFINGLMETILNNLSNTSDLNVRSRTSVEKYRNINKSLPEIARELNVNYIVEGSGQKYGDLVVLNIKLLEAFSDRHLFSKQYKREVKDVQGFADLHSEIAIELATNIKSSLNLENVKWYKRISTENFEALSCYLQGLELNNLSVGHKNWIVFQLQAKAKFEKALEHDSTFVLPMVQLGWIFSSLNEISSSENHYQDSAYYYAYKAKNIDSGTADVYVLQGWLYQNSGEFDKALENYNMALQYSDNFKMERIYGNMGLLNFQKGDYLKGMEFLYKQLHTEIEDGQSPNYWTLHSLYQHFRLLGFFQESCKYSNKILDQNNDSVAYFDRLMNIHFTFGNYDSVLHVWNRRVKIDSSNVPWTVFRAFTFLKSYQSAALWYEKYGKEIRPQQFSFESFANSGLAYNYLQNGQKDIADSLFQESIKLLKDEIGYFPEFNISNINLASIYSATGEKEAALKFLNENESNNLLTLTTLKYNPMLDNIRNNAEFQKILENVEIKFRENQELVRKYLFELKETE